MRHWLTCLMMLSTAVLTAEDDGWLKAIRPDHPRMFFNADTWPAVKARALGPAARQFEMLLKRVDGYPDNPVCSGFEPVEFREVKTASGTHRVTANTPIREVSEWGRQAAECAFAWRVTGKPDYLEKARRMLVSSAAAYRQAIANGRAVCWYSTKRILALCAYDWLHEGLTPEQRREIILPLLAHVDEVQTENRQGRRIVRLNSSGISTGFYGVESLLWFAGLAAYGDGIADDQALAQLRKGYDWFIRLLDYRAASAGDDGGLSSAVHGYCMGAYPWAHFNFLHTYLSATGVNLASRWPSLGLFPNWIFWNMIPDAEQPTRPLSFGFGDDQHTDNRMSVGNLYEHMTQYMHFFRDFDHDSARLAASLRAFTPNRSLASNWPIYPFILDDAPAVAPYTQQELQTLPLKARHFETLGQVVMRSGWSPSSVYCLFTSGAKLTQHKHHDENNFVIYHRGFLALDSGTRGIETDHQLRHYYAQTVAHNCILIHKPGEPMPNYWGMRFNGPEGNVNHGGMYGFSGRLLAFQTDDAFSYAAGDATAAYGDKCTEAIRQLVHLQPDCFVIYDRVAASQPDFRKEWLLHTQNQPTLTGQTLRADEHHGRLFCQTLLPLTPELRLVGGPGREFWASGRNWEMDADFLAGQLKRSQTTGRPPLFGNWRLEVSPGAPSASDRFLHLLSVGPADDSFTAPPTATLIRTETQDGLEFVRHGRRFRLLFNRTGAVGGSLLIHDASGRLLHSAALSETIQPQSGSSVPQP